MHINLSQFTHDGIDCDKWVLFFLGSRASTPLSVSLPGSDSDHSVSGDDLDGSKNMVSSDDEFEFS